MNKNAKIIILIILLVGLGALAVNLKNKKTNENVITPPTQENLQDEQSVVEKYIKDNIKTIATDSPVLGGSWYVVDLKIDPETNTGEVTYEDGHIQSKADFSYVYDEKSNDVSIDKFEVIK